MYGTASSGTNPSRALDGVQDEQQRSRHLRVLVENVAELFGHEKRLNRAEVHRIYNMAQEASIRRSPAERKRRNALFLSALLGDLPVA